MIIRSPNLLDVFCAYFYSNTYLAPVDLSDEGLSKHLLTDENSTKAAELISREGVEEILSSPLSYDSEKIQQNNKVLKNQGFVLLGSKDIGNTTIPYYSVLEHKELPNYIIKSGAVRIPKDKLLSCPSNDKETTFSEEEESLFRIEMANRIKKIAQENQIDVIIPKKYLVAYKNSENIQDPTKKYCVLCEKINIPSVEETLKNIKENPKEVAKKISKLIEKTGFVDAHFGNIRVTKDLEIVITDTEPMGLMVAKGSASQRGTSVQQCARIGLYTLMMQKSVSTILPEFHSQLKQEYASLPKLSKWKFALCFLSLGIFPLGIVIASLFKVIYIGKMLKEIQKISTPPITWQKGVKPTQSLSENEKNIKITDLQKEILVHTKWIPGIALELPF